MLNLISAAIAKTNSFLKEHQVDRLFAGVLAAILLFVTNADLGENSKPVGERVGDQLEQTSKRTERPKTLGEFRDEAEGDVPAGERVKNITRDSAEAFGQFGEGITTSIKEGFNELKNNVTGENQAY